ncbi:thiamine pyrophosphate-dependent enzyme [Streptomyces sp. NPDC060048]|uniref:thiamine pyrophosphate-dependent enzyme n=1 Tax=unclassified Streptomyces TaxID=2593676 RepID=UPI003674E468
MSRTLTKSAAVAAIVAAVPHLPAIFATGYISRIAASMTRQDHHFYMTGSMGLALSIGTGFALSARRTTLVVDGDGSLLMNPVGLIAAGAATDLPLIHAVLDDGRYDSTGGQPTPGHTTDLSAWARACGIRDTHVFTEEDHLSTHLPRIARDCRRPVFIRCLVAPDADAPPPRVSEDLAGIAERFRRAVAAPAPAVTTGGR